MFAERKRCIYIVQQMSQVFRLLNLVRTGVVDVGLKQTHYRRGLPLLIVQQQRDYAKGGDRGGAKKLRPNEDALAETLDVESLRQEMQHVLDQLKTEYVQKMTARVSLQALENIVVKIPDIGDVPLNHVAQVTLKTPQLAIVNLTSSPNAVKPAAEAITNCGLGLAPQVQTNNFIYVPLPKPSREHRETMAKNAKLFYSRCHERLRSIDSSYQMKMRPLEKKISKDTFKAAQLALHAVVKEYAHQAEEMMKFKQKELLEEVK